MVLGELVKYCIKVDYRLWSEETDEEYSEPRYVCVDIQCMRMLYFSEELHNSELRIFDDWASANQYAMRHSLYDGICCYNVRIVPVLYSFVTGKFVEVDE